MAKGTYAGINLATAISTARSNSSRRVTPTWSRSRPTSRGACATARFVTRGQHDPYFRGALIHPARGPRDRGRGGWTAYAACRRKGEKR